MTGDFNVITFYGKDHNDVSVDEFKPGTPDFGDIQINKIGKSTVGIKFGKIALTLRFKFESKPTSSIKLAVSYESFPDESENENINKITIQKVEDLINAHQCTKDSNDSNAIGKCHEALTYYYFLREFPEIIQVDPEECGSLLAKYSANVKPNTLEKLFTSTSTIVPVICDKLTEKYSHFKLESIELIPDSYLEDPLNTGDIQLILKVNGKYATENISLKAIAKRGGKITTKNPKWDQY